MPVQPTPLEAARADYEALTAQGLSLDIQRGQPSDADFDLSDDLLEAVKPGDTVEDGVELRNYPGSPAGLPSARALFAAYLDVSPDDVLVWNNSSLELQAMVLTFALLHGLPASPGPWVREAQAPKVIVTTPGYDRHFHLLDTLGFEMIAVDMHDDGPDVEAVAAAAADPAVKALLFVPTYSNPTGATTSLDKARALVALQAAAPDFTILADDAYRAHHLSEDHDTPVQLLDLCQAAAHPDRVVVFGSTSKITYAGGGLGFLAASRTNHAWLARLLSAQSIGPNKVEQARHVRFLGGYPGGLEGLMRAHAAIAAPKFAAVDEALTDGLGAGGGGYAEWSTPRGGYFISLDTADPVADRVVALAKAVGLTLTPAGATFPHSDDPGNRNIRIAPTRPPLQQVRAAADALAVCIRYACEEHRAATA
ncbi:MAG: aminotransferase class I/II-fold pyridoxal phosphate-dependent enzyme [Dermatophilaceae bacterium]